MYSIENQEQRTIKDIFIHKRYLCILYDKNEVAVFDVKSGIREFRAIYRDAN